MKLFLKIPLLFLCIVVASTSPLITQFIRSTLLSYLALVFVLMVISSISYLALKNNYSKPNRFRFVKHTGLTLILSLALIVPSIVFRGQKGSAKFNYEVGNIFPGASLYLMNPIGQSMLKGAYSLGGTYLEEAFWALEESILAVIIGEDFKSALPMAPSFCDKRVNIDCFTEVYKEITDHQEGRRSTFNILMMAIGGILAVDKDKHMDANIKIKKEDAIIKRVTRISKISLITINGLWKNWYRLDIDDEMREEYLSININFTRKLINKNLKLLSKTKGNESLDIQKSRSRFSKLKIQCNKPNFLSNLDEFISELNILSKVD